MTILHIVRGTLPATIIQQIESQGHEVIEVDAPELMSDEAREQFRAQFESEGEKS